MQYPCPHIPELCELLEVLERFSVPVYLRGYLNSDPGMAELFPFVDICHEWAAGLQDGLPSGLRLIYPYPPSSQACMEGLPDPLQNESCRDLAQALRDHRPRGCSDSLFERCFEGLVGQAHYVLRYAPSRLVLTGRVIPDRLQLERWLSQSG